MDFLAQYLKSAKPIVVTTPGYYTYDEKNKNNHTHAVDMIIPPLNTDIRFSDVLPQYEPPPHSHAHYSSTSKTYKDEQLPDANEMYDPPWVDLLTSLRKKGADKPTEDATSSPTPRFVVPPLNTDIRFTQILPRFVSETHVDKKNKTYTHVSTSGITTVAGVGGGAVAGVGGGAPAGDPSHVRGTLHYHHHTHENFSWTIPTSHDDEEAIKKKLLIHPVFDQQGCGSCWAVAVATTMSDCLVVGESIDYFPSISPTFCMACYPQGKCAGGMPAKLALDIQNNGVADTTCVDYSWCVNNEACNIRNSAAHFDVNHTKLSETIPKCGCLSSNEKLYYFLDPTTDTFSITDDITVDHYKQLVRYHILDFGPVVGGYVVLNNFVDGKFSKIGKGVYFDRADYGNATREGVIPFSDDVASFENSKGLHAVSIVGWGLAKDVQYDTDKRGDVPFWFCRNSWGKNWGEHGFFKMAMYPFNKVAQFDKEIEVKVGGQSTKIGGLMLIRATSPPIRKRLPTIDRGGIKLLENNAFYGIS